jgi:hypothetical protein
MQARAVAFVMDRDACRVVSHGSLVFALSARLEHFEGAELMSDRSRKIADAVAKRIMANTRKRWTGTLHEDALSDAERELMSQEKHATGNGSTGPMSPESTKTRGRSQREAAGFNQNSEADVSGSCQVQVSIPAPQRGQDKTGSARRAFVNPTGAQEDGTL